MKNPLLHFGYVLFVLCYVAAVPVLAGSITITSPSNGQIFYAPVGSSTALVWINQTWQCSPYPYIGCEVRVYVDGNQIPEGGYNWYYSLGDHTVRAELWETYVTGQQFKTAEHSVSFTVKGTYSVVVRNSFNSGYVKVDGQQYSSGTSFEWRQDELHTIEAISPQNTTQDGFPYTWNYDVWRRDDGVQNAGNPWQTQVAHNATYTARFSGLITISGTHTIQNGETGVVQPRTTVRFESGGKLMVNGRLVANGTSDERITFTRSGTSGDWQGIEFSGSGANNSSLQYCDILYATMPIKATNTSNLTISNVTIGNSSFYNGCDNAAMAFYNSSPNISYTTINGQSNSQNGVRFAQNSTGGISGCTIQNLGYGNGIVIQGGSNPAISGNTIRNNYYHGITINDAGTNALITGNIIYGNRYNGIRSFSYAAGKMRDNNIYANGIGIHVHDYSSAQSGYWGDPWWEPGRNIITSNTNGIISYNNSNAVFGIYDAFEDKYYGACNQIYGNQTWDANAAQSSSLVVQGNWWGQSPPDYSKIGSSPDSWISYAYWRPYDDYDCLPGGGNGGPLSVEASTSTAPSAEQSEDAALNQALLARLKGQHADAKSLYASVLADSRKENERRRALVGLMEVWKESKDPLLTGVIESYRTSSGRLGIIADELLMGMYAATGRFADMKVIALRHKARYPGSEQEKFALLQLASLAGYSESERATAQLAYRELVEKFPDTDKGVLVAINPGVPVGDIAEQKSTSDDSPLLSNYPNPFNPSTTIRFRVQTAGFTSLKVYDLLGREIAVLVHEQKEPGVYSVRWDAGQLPSGMYFYRLESANKFYIQKMLLVR